MKEFDFKKYCVTCGAWCCKGEKNILKGNKIVDSKKNGDCVFLKNGICSNYSKRPFDCRDFPIDVMIIRGKVTWIVWKNCPALKELNLDDFLEQTEKSLLKKYGKETILAQAISNKTMLPKKYKKRNMKILKEIKFD